MMVAMSAKILSSQARSCVSGFAEPLPLGERMLLRRVILPLAGAFVGLNVTVAIVTATGLTAGRAVGAFFSNYPAVPRNTRWQPWLGCSNQLCPSLFFMMWGPQVAARGRAARRIACPVCRGERRLPCATCSGAAAIDWWAYGHRLSETAGALLFYGWYQISEE